MDSQLPTSYWWCNWPIRVASQCNAGEIKWMRDSFYKSETLNSWAVLQLWQWTYTGWGSLLGANLSSFVDHVLAMKTFRKKIAIKTFLQESSFWTDHLCQRRHLGPWSPGSSGARVTLGVLIGVRDWHSASLILIEPREEVVHHRGVMSGDFVPLLRVFFDVKQHHGLQGRPPWRCRLGGVVAGPREPQVTSWRRDVASSYGTHLQGTYVHFFTTVLHFFFLDDW